MRKTWEKSPVTDAEHSIRSSSFISQRISPLINCMENKEEFNIVLLSSENHIYQFLQEKEQVGNCMLNQYLFITLYNEIILKFKQQDWFTLGSVKNK